jgi:phosphoglycerate dehydrogenase-like enzyme
MIIRRTEDGRLVVYRTLDNVLATSHIAYVAQDLYRTFHGDAAATIEAWLDENAGRKRT